MGAGRRTRGHSCHPFPVVPRRHQKFPRLEMIVIFDCEQNSTEWYRARMGLPTASEFATILAKGKDGGASLTRQTYMRKLAGEIITDEPMESYVNAAMERGKIMEAEARDF